MSNTDCCFFCKNSENHKAYAVTKVGLVCPKCLGKGLLEDFLSKIKYQCQICGMTLGIGGPWAGTYDISFSKYLPDKQNDSPEENESISSLCEKCFNIGKNKVIETLQNIKDSNVQ